MNDISKKITTTLPVKTSQYFKDKWKLLLIEIGVKWFMEKVNTKQSPLNILVGEKIINRIIIVARKIWTKK